MGKWLRLAVGSALLVGVAGGAQATIILHPTSAGTGNNVVFNQQPPNQTDTTIFGNMNGPNNTLVQFTSTQVLTTPAQGQERIVSVPPNSLDNLIITIPGFATTQTIFNLDATADGSATIFAADQFGTIFTFRSGPQWKWAELLYTYRNGGRTYFGCFLSPLRSVWRT